MLPEPGEKEGLVLTGWRATGGDAYSVEIDPIVERDALTLRARGVAIAPPDSTASDRLNGALFAMAAFNYRMAIGGWGFDPSDGEAAFRIGIPIKGRNLEYEDFELALNVLVVAVESQGRALREILAGEKTAQDAIVASRADLGG